MTKKIYLKSSLKTLGAVGVLTSLITLAHKVVNKTDMNPGAKLLAKLALDGFVGKQVGKYLNDTFKNIDKDDTVIEFDCNGFHKTDTNKADANKADTDYSASANFYRDDSAHQENPDEKVTTESNQESK